MHRVPRNIEHDPLLLAEVSLASGSPPKTETCDDKPTTSRRNLGHDACITVDIFSRVIQRQGAALITSELTRGW